jgi:hypothetical protein
MFALFAVLCLGAPLHGRDEFALEVTATVSPGGQSAKARADRLESRSQLRPVLKLKRSQPITVKWIVTCTAPQANYKDLLIHLFVVKEQSAGQRAIPKLDKDVAAESALTMDFRPKDKARGEMHLRLESGGAYLLRLETVGAIGSANHEFSAALDLVVE